MADAEYLTISHGGVAWVAAAMPAFPAWVGQAAPAVVATDVANYESEKAIVHKSINLENQLQQQILEAVPVLYLKALASRRLGFVGVTAKIMLAHLNDFYGTISSDDLEANMERAKATWNINNPVEEVFEQVLDAVDFAAAGGDEITEATSVRIVIKIFEDSGVMDDAVKDGARRQQQRERGLPSNLSSSRPTRNDFESSRPTN